MAKTDAPAPLKIRDRVVATRPLRGVPEGAGGTVKVANGLTWDRYWVQFDNGLWIGSVSGSDLVRERDWEEFKRRRAEEAARPRSEAKEEPVAAAAEAAGGATAGAAASKVPAHLLERSQKARARKAGGE
ncbi:MAG: hypothetical protein KY454_02095 [Actinobacteria bacterium]|nr:hypothetical protein [Actinomycetota bacterium]MBW3649481.1 hypothetical protein [Actinomycetota bacterium]